MIKYIFPGLGDSSSAGAVATCITLGGPRELWHCKQIQDSLGELSRLDPAQLAPAPATCASIRDSLALAPRAARQLIEESRPRRSCPPPRGRKLSTQARKEALSPCPKTR